MLFYITLVCALGAAVSEKLPTNYGSPTAGGGGGQQPVYAGGDQQPNYNDQPTYGQNELSADEQNLKMLMGSVPGTPGEDYPILSEVPDTAFSCKGQKVGGYYADPEAECQVFHVCAEDGDGPRSKWSFLCPNGTIFNQNYFICDWWFNFDCADAEGLYSLNDQLGETGDNLASYNGAESQSVPTYQSGNAAAPPQPNYQNGNAPSRSATPPKPKAAPAASKPKAAAPKSAPKPAPKAAPAPRVPAPAPAAGSYAAPAAGSYGAPTDSAAPAGSYGAPTESAAPAGSYGAPAGSNYGAPSSAPNSNYGAPSDDYDSASANSNYGAPAGEDDLPDYSSAQDNYAAPAAAAPGSSYGAPAGANYGAPSDEGAVTQPSTLYGAPAGSNYGAPESDAPIGDYSSPQGAAGRAGRQRNGRQFNNVQQQGRNIFRNGR